MKPRPQAKIRLHTFWLADPSGSVKFLFAIFKAFDFSDTLFSNICHEVAALCAMCLPIKIPYSFNVSSKTVNAYGYVSNWLIH